jgi:hypothetical protein
LATADRLVRQAIVNSKEQIVGLIFICFFRFGGKDKKKKGKREK